MSRPAAIASAETMAFLRAVVARAESVVVRCEDLLAALFLGCKYWLLNSAGMQGAQRNAGSGLRQSRNRPAPEGAAIRATAIQSAETLALLRALVAGERNLATPCVDHMAKHFLGLKYRLLAAVGRQPLCRLGLELAAPGSYGFTIARTRHFDEILLSESRAGVEQIALLGAGYDSRPLRFRDVLVEIKIFELDHPGTQARKRRMMERAGWAPAANLCLIPADFNRRSLKEVLEENGFVPGKKTLFLWEGVSYYLPRNVVESVLDFVAGCAPGSSIVFDYAIRRFVDGDCSTHGGRQVARWLKKIGEPFLFGLNPEETEQFLHRRKLRVVSDLGPGELERSYLQTKSGGRLGRTLGHVRMVHARVGLPHDIV